MGGSVMGFLRETGEVKRLVYERGDFAEPIIRARRRSGRLILGGLGRIREQAIRFQRFLYIGF